MQCSGGGTGIRNEIISSVWGHVHVTVTRHSDGGSVQGCIDYILTLWFKQVSFPELVLIWRHCIWYENAAVPTYVRTSVEECSERRKVGNTEASNQCNSHRLDVWPVNEYHVSCVCSGGVTQCVLDVHVLHWWDCSFISCGRAMVCLHSCWWYL